MARTKQTARKDTSDSFKHLNELPELKALQKATTASVEDPRLLEEYLSDNILTDNQKTEIISFLFRRNKLLFIYFIGTQPLSEITMDLAVRKLATYGIGKYDNETLYQWFDLLNGKQKKSLVNKLEKSHWGGSVVVFARNFPQQSFGDTEYSSFSSSDEDKVNTSESESDMDTDHIPEGEIESEDIQFDMGMHSKGEKYVLLAWSRVFSDNPIPDKIFRCKAKDMETLIKDNIESDFVEDHYTSAEDFHKDVISWVRDLLKDGETYPESDSLYRIAAPKIWYKQEGESHK